LQTGDPAQTSRILDEAERRKLRREKNKIAATRCRKRKKEKHSNLFKVPSARLTLHSTKL
jgi:hypothetical protein